MDISYAPLFKTMQTLGVSQYKLMRDTPLDYHTMQSIREGKNISTKTLGKICKCLNCTPNDVITFQ